MSTEKSLRDDIVAALGSEYEIVRELGRGGASVVYLARDRVLGREVAIKVIRDSHSGDPEQIARLAREARTLALLQHPNIVMLYGAKQLPGGTLALVMQHGEWVTLKSIIRERGALEIAMVEQVLRDVASALLYLHEHRIFHRDIKPENIFIEARSGRALLSDFGIAKSGDATSSVTLTGVVIGTPAYMSPEQIDGAPLTGQSDLYSLGMVGYEMLTGIRPWEGESLFSVIYKQKTEQLPAISEKRPDVPERLARLIDRATRKDPADRWADAGEFLQVLATSTEAEAPRSWAAETAPTPTPDPSPTEYPTLEMDRIAIGQALSEGFRSHRRKRRRLVSAVLVVLLCSGGAGALAFSGKVMGGDDSPPVGQDGQDISTLDADLRTDRLLSRGTSAAVDDSSGLQQMSVDSGVPSIPATASDSATREPPPSSREAVTPRRTPQRQAAAQQRTRSTPPPLAPSIAVTRPTGTEPRVSQAQVLQPLGASSATSTPQLQNREAVAQLLADRYPTDLRERGVGGTTVLTVLVAADGAVEQASVVTSSGNARLDEAARAVSSRMIFRHPAGAAPRAVWVAVPLTFNPK